MAQAGLHMGQRQRVSRTGCSLDGKMRKLQARVHGLAALAANGGPRPNRGWMR